MKQNKLIAITGGIGSGKSEVVGILKILGHPVLSCDNFTPKAYQKWRSKRFFKKEFPQAVSKETGYYIDKKILGDIVFTNKEKYDKLNGFLLPIILKLVLRQAKKLKGKVFIEVPLLFESNFIRF